VYSKDSKGQTTSSSDFSYQTPMPAKQKSPFDFILETLQKVLGVFKNIF
jgi:hypothetical protein